MKLSREVWLISIVDPQLYSSFAAPLQLLEIILLIVHVSDHRDSSLVDATWDAILDRGELNLLSYVTTRADFRMHFSGGRIFRKSYRDYRFESRGIRTTIPQF